MTNNVLVDEANRKHAEHAARARAVAGAKSFDEAYRLGAQHAQQEAAENANNAAYTRGARSADTLSRPAMPTQAELDQRVATRLAAKASRRAAARAVPVTAKAPAAVGVKALAPAPAKAAAPAAKVPAAGKGNFVIAARRYKAEQLAKGNRITTAEAVAHVSKLELSTSKENDSGIFQ